MRRSLSISLLILLLILPITSFGKIIHSQEVAPDIRTSTFTITELRKAPIHVGPVVFTNLDLGINIYSQNFGYYVQTPAILLALRGYPIPLNANITKLEISLKGRSNIELSIDFLKTLFGTGRSTRVNNRIKNQIRALLKRAPKLVVTYTVPPVVINQPPVITSNPTTNVNSGDLYQYQVTATDPENDTLTYTLTAAPNGMTIDSNGLVQWQTDPNYSGGDVSVDILVSDGGNVVHQTFQLTLTQQQLNNSPSSFEIVNPVSGTVDNPLSPTFKWTESVDPEGQPVTYSLFLGTGGKLGVPINPVLVASGIINTNYTLTNSLEYNTPYVWYVEATDGINVTTSNTGKFNTLQRPNSPPVVDAGADQTVTSGDTVTLDGSNSIDPDGDQLYYIWALTQGDGSSVVLSSSNSAVTTFVAPVVDHQIQLIFRLWTTDTQAQSTDEVIITVDPSPTN